MNFRRWFENIESGIGYHVTSKKNLPSIASRGLVPGYKSTWHKDYRGHGATGVFFTTDPEDAAYWMGFGKIYVDPVLLRFGYDIDELVSKDSHASTEGHTNFILPRKVPAQEIEFWTGKTWLPITNYADLQYADYTIGRQKKAKYPRTIGSWGFGDDRIWQYKGKWWDSDTPPEGIKFPISKKR